jgi:hypothetical protein
MRQLPRLAAAMTMAAFALFVRPCIAQSKINPAFALQACRAFAAKLPSKMPAGVPAGPAERFFLVYGPFAAILTGCVLAAESSRTQTSITFLVQHTRFESHWTISLSGSAIDEVLISDYRPITPDGNGLWQVPFLPPARN